MNIDEAGGIAGSLQQASGGQAMAVTSARLHYIDSLRAFVMSIGVVLHAGLIASFWLPKSINFVSGMFRMNLFVFIAGFFVALLLDRRTYGTVIKDRIIRFGVPAITIICFVSWIDHYYFYNLLVEPRTFREILTAAPTWNVAGFDWPRAPKFMTWHGQMWFLLIIIVYCLCLRLFLGLASSAALDRAISWLGNRPPRFASLMLAITMASLLLAGRIVHFLTTQQVLGGGPFNFIAQMAWLYSPWFLLGIVAFRNTLLMNIMHKVYIPNILGAATFLAIANKLDPIVRNRFGMVGGESLEYFSRGLMGFYICVMLLWVFRRYANSHSRAVRFLSEASYTVYLFHISVIAAAGYYIRMLGLSNEATWMLVILTAYPACLAIHYLIVDRGALLKLIFNGKPLARTPDKPVAAST